MSNSLLKNKTSYYIHTIIMLTILAVFYFFVPAVEPLTPLGIKVLGVFFAMLYGWLFCDVIWPSLLGLVMLAVCGYDTIDNVLLSAFGNSTVILIFLFCAVTAILSAAGVADYIANKLVSLKIVQGRPYTLTFMLLIVMIILNLLLSATPAFIMMVPLIKEVATRYGFKPGDVWPMYTILAANWVGCVAYQLLPFKAGPAMVFGSYSELSGITDINYIAYIACVAAMLIATIAIVLLFCRFIVKPDVTPILKNKSDMQNDEKLTSMQKYVLISFIVLLVAMLLPNIAPADWALTTILKTIGTNGLLLIYIALYVFLNFRDGINFKMIMSRDMAWPALSLVASALTIAGAFKDDSTGIIAWIGEIVAPIVEGRSVVLFVGLIILLTTIMTNVANNMATLAIFTPLAYTVGISTGADINMLAVMLCVLMTGAIGLATPPASSTTAYLAGEKEWVPGNSVMKYGVIFCVFNMIIVYVFGFGLGSLLF